MLDLYYDAPTLRPAFSTATDRIFQHERNFFGIIFTAVSEPVRGRDTLHSYTLDVPQAFESRDDL